jgi:hypothetical protein
MMVFSSSQTLSRLKITSDGEGLIHLFWGKLPDPQYLTIHHHGPTIPYPQRFAKKERSCCWSGTIAPMTSRYFGTSHDRDRGLTIVPIDRMWSRSEPRLFCLI